MKQKIMLLVCLMLGSSMQDVKAAGSGEAIAAALAGATVIGVCSTAVLGGAVVYGISKKVRTHLHQPSEDECAQIFNSLEKGMDRDGFSQEFIEKLLSCQKRYGKKRRQLSEDAKQA